MLNLSFIDELALEANHHLLQASSDVSKDTHLLQVACFEVQ
jgi:hypothetical protein